MLMLNASLQLSSLPFETMHVSLLFLYESSLLTFSLFFSVPY